MPDSVLLGNIPDEALNAQKALPGSITATAQTVDGSATYPEERRRGKPSWTLLISGSAPSAEGYRPSEMA
jgi:hypothetical protein